MDEGEYRKKNPAFGWETDDFGEFISVVVLELTKPQGEGDGEGEGERGLFSRASFHFGRVFAPAKVKGQKFKTLALVSPDSGPIYFYFLPTG